MVKFPKFQQKSQTAKCLNPNGKKNENQKNLGQKGFDAQMFDRYTLKKETRNSTLKTKRQPKRGGHSKQKGVKKTLNEIKHTEQKHAKKKKKKVIPEKKAKNKKKKKATSPAKKTLKQKDYHPEQR